MNIKELKEQIKDLPDDLEVVVYADHGQNGEWASEIRKETCVNDGCGLQPLAAEDCGECPEDEVDVVMIYGM